VTSAAGGGEYPWTYQVDLNRVARVDRVVVSFNPNGYATTFDVLVSADGTHWVTVAQKSDNSKAGPHALNFKPADTRYVRVRGIKPDGPDQPGGQMSITELEVYQAK